MQRQFTLTDLAAHFQRSSAKLRSGNHRPALQRAKELLFAGTKRAFSSGMDPVTGTGWTPTQRQNPTLVDTGKLMASALSAVQSATITKTRLTISGIIWYGEFHDTGTSRMPRRRFLGFSAKDMNGFDKILADLIYGYVKAP